MLILKKFAIVAALAALALPAAAADLPTKAPPRSSALFSGYPYSGSGFYFGINSLGGGGSVAAAGVGVNPNSVVSTEMGLGGTLGYVYGNGNVFYAVEAMFDWNNFNGSAPGFSFGGPATFEQRVKVGTPLNNFLSLFPSLNLPTVPPFPSLPNGQVATNIHPYLSAGLREDDVSLNFNLSRDRAWKVMPVLGTGMMGQLTNGVAIDTWVEVGFGDTGLCAGALPTGGCGKIGNQYRVGLGLYY